MTTNDPSLWFLTQEARAMLTRVDRVRPLVLKETMVPAAAPSLDAQAAIEQMLFTGRRALRGSLLDYLSWLDSASGRGASSPMRHRRFVGLKLRFNAILFHFDLFAEAVSQRSQAETGVWLAGLDAAARDALTLPGRYVPPPVLCFLAKDPGGAIRRVRSRLPGGQENPVALIRLPRERMLGSGLASSLAHEAGHQATALLGLMGPLRLALERVGRSPEASERAAWVSWQSCLSEVLADLWAIGKIGVASTLGLISLVSLPRAMVFQANEGDPHPTPWLRVKLSCALGDALYPHPQWQRLARIWEGFYPRAEIPPKDRTALERREALIPKLAYALLAATPPTLGGTSLGDALRDERITPASLRELERRRQGDPTSLRKVLPMTAFATLGQARMDAQLTPEAEADLLEKLLEHWALRSALTRAHRYSRMLTPPSRPAAKAASVPITRQRSRTGEEFTWNP